MLKIKNWLFIGIYLVFSSTLIAQEVVDKNSIEHLIPLPLTRQSMDYTCGAALALSILGYYGDNALECDIASQMGTNTDYGTAHQQMIQFFQSKGYQVSAQEGMTISQLKENLSQGKPVVCLIQAWQDDVNDYTNYWGIGHYVVAIGYNNERIYFMDPWCFGNYCYIPVNEFVNRWHQFTHEQKYLTHWGMVVSKEKPSYRPDAVYYIP